MEPLKHQAAPSVLLPKQRLETLVEDIESEMQHMSVELLRKIIDRMSPGQRQAIVKLGHALQFAAIWGESE